MTKGRVSVIESGTPAADAFDSLYRLVGLGPLSISSYLHLQGYEVKFFAMFASTRLDDQFISSSQYVLVSTMTHTSKLAYALAQRFRKSNPEAVFILGGVHGGVLMQDALQYFDFVVINEGEATVLELLRFLDSNPKAEPTGIRGLAFKNRKGEMVHTGDRPFLQDIDFPLNPSLVYEYPTTLRDLLRCGRLRYPTNLIHFSRGCPYACNFCLGMRQLGKLYRTRSPRTVIEDLNRFRQMTGSQDAIFHDNEFTIDREATKELLREIIRAHPGVRYFTVFARIESTRDEELWHLFEEAGVTLVVFGVESLNQSSLDGFNKRSDLDEIHSAMARIERFKTLVVTSFIIGDVDDPLKELALIRQFKKDYSRKISRVVVASLMEYPHQEKLRGQKQLIPDERFIHHDWNYYSGDYLYFYPRTVRPSVLQAELLKTIRTNNAIPSGSMWNFYRRASDAFIRYSHRPIGKRIERYIDFLRDIERDKYNGDGRLIFDALSPDDKPRELNL